MYFIFHRNGTKDIEIEVTVTTWIKLTKSQSVTTKVGLEYSLKSSISAGIDGLSAGMESTFTLYAQVETSISSSEEKFWPKEIKEKYTAPAGKFIELCKHCWIFLVLWM